MTADKPTALAERLPGGLPSVAEVLLDAYTHWRDTRTLRLGAGLAYYTLFAIAPLLSLAAAIAAWTISTEEARQFVADALDGLSESAATELARNIVDTVSGSAMGVGVLGTVTVLVSASFLFLALQDALNVIWEAPVRVGWRNTIRRRLLSLVVALAVAAFFLSSLVISAVAGLAERLVPGEHSVVEPLSELVTSAASWVVGVLMIALLFRVLPYAKVRWRDAILGAAITALLASVSSWLVGTYLSRFGATSITGAAGGVVLSLVFVYAQAQILLGGAVLTKILGDRAVVGDRRAVRSGHVPRDGFAREPPNG